jgi:DNA polymerase-3 subunit delta
MVFQADKAAAHRVVFLGGDEEILRRRALASLLAFCGADADAFDVENMEGGINTPGDWIAASGTAPFLAARRIVTVRRLLRTDIDGVKRGVFKSLPETALIILVADDEAGDDERQRRLRQTRAAWEKLVAAEAGHVESFKLDPRAIRQMVKDEAESLDRKISEASLDLLIEMTGGGLSRAFEELEKLALFTQGETAIREAEIRQLVAPTREWNVFKLVDALASGQVAEALRQLKILVGSQSKAEDAAMRSILPQTSRSLKLLWQGRLFFEAGRQPAAPTPELLEMLPERPRLSNEMAFLQTRTMNVSRRLTLDQIADGLEIVARTDARLKGLGDAFSAMDTLESMVLEMAAAFQS